MYSLNQYFIKKKINQFNPSRNRKIYAAYQFFLYTQIGSLFLLLALIILYLEAGTSDYLTLLAQPVSINRQYFLWLTQLAKINFVVRSFSNLLSQYPRSRRNYLPPNTTSTDLVVFGSILPSTIGYPRYTKIIRNMCVFPSKLRSIFVGLVLSDAWLFRKSNGSVLFGFKQSLRNFAYFWFIFTYFSHQCSSLPCLTITHLKGKVYYGIQFATRVYPFFTPWYNLFYPCSIKVVPLELYYQLDYEALAHWIMSDSSRDRNALVLQAQSFSVQEAVLLISILIYKFDLDCSLHMQRGLPVIYISTASMRKLYPFILPYMLPSMLYKLGNFG